METQKKAWAEAHFKQFGIDGYDPSYIDESIFKGAYFKGWEECEEHYASLKKQPVKFPDWVICIVILFALAILTFCVMYIIPLAINSI